MRRFKNLGVLKALLGGGSLILAILFLQKVPPAYMNKPATPVLGSRVVNAIISSSAKISRDGNLSSSCVLPTSGAKAERESGVFFVGCGGFF
ncbi:hypothetical protein EXS56_02350 [Candidatus Kaiserbacteria bacterium]|nr:hypothetical protein [Candidatus Kaiserbacteria bacterium]